MVMRSYARKRRSYRKKPALKKSYTKKKTYFKKRSSAKKMSNVLVQGAGGQISRYVSANPYMSSAARLIKRFNTSDYIYNNYASRISCGVGSMAAFATSLCAAGPFTATPTYDQDLSAIQYKVTGGITGVAKTCRFLVENVSHDFRITNQDSASVEIHIYDLSIKRDNNTPPVTSWFQGVNDQYGAVTWGANNLPIGSVPQQSQLFNQQYTVRKHTRVILGQGQCHSHTVMCKINKMFNSETLTDSNINVKGFTQWTMITVNGLGVNDSVTKTQVSSSVANVDVVATKVVRYTWTSDNQSNWFYNNNLPSAFTSGSAQIMNIGTGALAIESNA